MDMDFTRTPDEEVELGSLVIETGDMPEASVIWLHGLGADGHDFESIVPQLLIPASMPIRFIFPDAPVRAVTINGGYMMRAWYDIYEDISFDAEQDEEGIKSSAGLLSLLVEEEMRRGIASDRIILAGFSQGGAVALYAGLTSDVPLGGVMALSAYLPLAPQLTTSTTNTQHLPSVFMAHGERDAVVPFSFAEIRKKNPQFINVNEPRWNIAAGIYYDRYLYRKITDINSFQHRLYLTFAGYNAGYGGILKAIKRAQQPREKASWKGLKRHLPKETQGYVSRIVTLKNRDLARR